MSHRCFTHRTRLAHTSLAVAVNSCHIHCGALSLGAVHPKDGAKLCMQGRVPRVGITEPLSKMTMALLIAGEITDRTALHQHSTVPELSVVGLFSNLGGQCDIAFALQNVP